MTKVELKTTRKKALLVGGLIHSNTDIGPHATTATSSTAKKKTKKLLGGQINQVTVNSFLKILKAHSVKNISGQGIHDRIVLGTKQ